MLWYVDDGGYYSSTTAKYLEYTTPPSLSSSLDSEESLLRAMFRLAHLTDRVLVLPEFHCHACAVTGLAGTKEACSGERPLCQRRGRAPMRVHMYLDRCVACERKSDDACCGRVAVAAPSGRSGDRDACSFLAHFRVANADAELRYRERMFRYSPLVPASIHLPSDAQSYDQPCVGGCTALSLAGVDTLASAAAAVRGVGGSAVVRVVDVAPALMSQRMRDVPDADAMALAFEDKLAKGIQRATPRQYT